MMAFAVRVLVACAVLITVACGSNPAGSTDVRVPETAGQVRAASEAGLPANFDAAAVALALPGIDPEYVRVLVYSTVTNTAETGLARPLQRWPAGVPMRHCIGEGVPQDAVEGPASIIAQTTGIPRVETGACSVEWAVDSTISGSGYAETLSPGHVRLVFHNEGSLRYGALHELGHVVGLGHSPHRSDLMYYLGLSDALAISADEQAVLRAMYGRR